ncbi:MAG: 50S ribosomal protein L10 [Flavobacteriales bacterium]|nr:50S ribosomal protein L10 [Flavobacteriales bacterium]
MNKDEKKIIIDNLTATLKESGIVYLANPSGMTVEKTNILRRKCFDKNITFRVVKNTLLKKAMEASEKDFSPLFTELKGTTAIFIDTVPNGPAKLIKDFQKTSDKLVLKGAFVDESCYVGSDQLEALVNIKSREELIADVVALLQSPIKNVMGALQNNGGQKIAGIVKALEERK